MDTNMAQPVASNSVPQQQVPQASGLNSDDPKLLLAQATDLVETAILRTATNPAARSNEIHAIKDAYQKVRYGTGDYSNNHDGA